MSPASPQTAETVVKTRRPTTNIRRRPYRSPSAAPVSSSAPKVSTYAVTTQPRVAGDAANWRLVGSADR
jgi:hypothetical protein